MLDRTSSCLRTAALSLRAAPRIQIWNNTKCIAIKPYIARQTRHLTVRPTISTCTRPASSAGARSHLESAKVATVIYARQASSSTAPPSTVQAESASQPLQALTWDGYLSLRQKRRYYNIITSSLTAVGTFAGGASFLFSQDIEKMSGFIFGFDPFMAMGLVCIGFGAAGWLIGPFAGGFLFRLTHRRVAGAMDIVSITTPRYIPFSSAQMSNNLVNPERERSLPANQEISERSHKPIDAKPSSRLLWRKDILGQGIPPVAERPKSIQKEARILNFMM